MIIRSNFIFMILSLPLFFFFFFFNDTATTEIYTLSLHDALPISLVIAVLDQCNGRIGWALDVVPLAHRQGQRRGRVAPGHAGVRSPAGASRARRSPSAPGVTGMGAAWAHPMNPSPSMTKNARSLNP